MVEIVLSYVNVSSIIAFVDVLEDVLYNMAVELHQEMKIIWYNP